MSDFTYCADCEFASGKDKLPPWRWMCLQHKRAEGYGFVTKTTWDDAPPYLFAKDVNGGHCPLFEPARTNQEEPY